MKTTASKKLFEAALRVMPGGVNSPVRAFKAVGTLPHFIARAKGAKLYDADGNAFVDYVMSWGPLVLGHAPAPVVKAVARAAARGTSYGAPTALEVQLAEMIVEAVPSMERVRLVSSGTEAVMSAIRLARAYTGRDAILKFEGCYHGHADSLLVKAGSGAMTLGIPTAPASRLTWPGTRSRLRTTTSLRSSACWRRTGATSRASSWSPWRATWAWCRPIPIS